MDDWMTEVTVDMLPDTQRRICAIIGLDATLRLCEEMGGGDVYIPNNDRVRAAARDIQIRKAFMAGVGVHTLAAKYGLTERRVRTLVEDIRPEQLDMWGDQETFGSMRAE